MVQEELEEETVRVETGLAKGGFWVLGHLSSPLLSPSAWQAGTGGLVPFSLPRTSGARIRLNDLVKKIVMEICNRETLSKASLKSLSTPSRVEGLEIGKLGDDYRTIKVAEIQSNLKV